MKRKKFYYLTIKMSVVVIPANTPLYANVCDVEKAGWNFYLKLPDILMGQWVKFTFPYDLKLNSVGFFNFYPTLDSIYLPSGKIYLRIPPYRNSIEDMAHEIEIIPVGTRLYLHQDAKGSRIPLCSREIYLNGNIAKSSWIVKHPIHIWNTDPTKYRKLDEKIYDGYLDIFSKSYILRWDYTSFLTLEKYINV